MYTSHFKFNAEPFQISTDPSFLWLGEQHKEALAILQYGVQENKGVIVLSGGVGTGKTTLINALMARIEGDVIAAVVSDPCLEPSDLFHYIANLFGIAKRVNGKADFLIQFIAFLKNAAQRKKKVLLIIDEAQRLKANLLEEIRLLSNIEHSGKRLLNVFLVGQNELNAMLLRSENRSLKQRIATQYNIVPLTLDEVRVYIDYRLSVVGCEQRPFTEGAIDEIFLFSKGYPRLINVICDQALISAFVENSRKVTADMVASSAKEFQFPNQMPSNASPLTDVKISLAGKTIAFPSKRTRHRKEPKRPSPKNNSVKNVMSSFRLASIGLMSVLFIFSGYLLYQYNADSTLSDPEKFKDGSNMHPSAVLDEKSPLENVQFRLSPPMQTHAVQPPEQKDTLKTDHIDTKSQHEKTPSANVPKETATQTKTDPATDKPMNPADPTEKSSTFTGRIIMPPESTSPPLPNDKDPGTIIEWLIQNKKNKTGN